MRVAVDEMACCSYGNCTRTAPGVFAIDGQSKIAAVLVDPVPPHDEVSAREAVQDCPSGALSWSDD